MTPKSYNNIFFDDQQSQSYKSAQIILPFVNEWVKPNSVIDVGCGVGAWLSACKSLGIEELTGLDGNYVSQEQLLISKDQFIVTDLENKIVVNTTYDLAICLEVGEHLSNKRAESFIYDLCNLSDIILFSAAVPGQEGTLHINEQYPDYWIDLFSKNDFECFDCLRPLFWKNNEVQFWYKQNIMLFMSKKKINRFAFLKELQTFNGNNITHPDLLNYKTAKLKYYESVLSNPFKTIRYFFSKMYHTLIK